MNIYGSFMNIYGSLMDIVTKKTKTFMSKHKNIIDPKTQKYF